MKQVSRNTLLMALAVLILTVPAWAKAPAPYSAVHAAASASLLAAGGAMDLGIISFGGRA